MIHGIVLIVTYRHASLVYAAERKNRASDKRGKMANFRTLFEYIYNDVRDVF